VLCDEIQQLMIAPFRIAQPKFGERRVFLAQQGAGRAAFTMAFSGATAVL
jgi:hypothetical protein